MLTGCNAFDETVEYRAVLLWQFVMPDFGAVSIEQHDVDALGRAGVHGDVGTAVSQGQAKWKGFCLGGADMEKGSGDHRGFGPTCVGLDTCGMAGIGDHVFQGHLRVEHVSWLCRLHIARYTRARWRPQCLFRKDGK